MVSYHKSSVYSKVELDLCHKMISFIRQAHVFVITLIFLIVIHFVEKRDCNSLLVRVLKVLLHCPMGVKVANILKANINHCIQKFNKVC